MIKVLVWVISCLFVFPCIADIEREELTSKQIKRLKKGIFEVVTLKLEDNTVYKEDFPFELIPFHLRKDKYHSVGTAFLIDDNTFVSAAHVFNIGYYSLLSENFSVRDSKGNIFKITQVEKYSNYRDLIQFTVEGNTSKYHKFSIASEYEEGDVVYAAGNALGEGVIFRKGSLTSFTYEPVNGEWKDIRYSAAASPGNSGGPLLNLKGEVIGIVTKKSSSENLNYALPIDEFVNFTSESAEFFMNQMSEVESTKQLRYVWKYNVSLPKDILSLRALAEKSFYQRFVDARKTFVTQYEKDIFPHHKNVDKYLKEQGNSDMLSIIDVNGNGEWLLFKHENIREVKINKDQQLVFSKNSKMLGNFQFKLNKPVTMKLFDFIQDKKGILDTFLTSMQWNRKISNTPVYITSYGTPSYEEQHTDELGRVWQMAIWNDQYSDRAIMLYCLPTPSGVVCDFIETSVNWVEVQRQAYKDNLHRMMLSYSAKLKEWEEYLALPHELIPSLFRKAMLDFDAKQGKMTFAFDEYNGSMENLKLTDDSNLYIAIEVDPAHRQKLSIGNIGVMPNVNEDGTYYVSKYYNQGEFASDSYKDFWDKFTSMKSPYNFEVINEGKTISKYMNLHAHKSSLLGANEDVGYLAVCTLQSEVKLEEFNRSCNTFIEGIK